MNYPIMPIHGVESLSYVSSNATAEEQVKRQRMKYTKNIKCDTRRM